MGREVGYVNTVFKAIGVMVVAAILMIAPMILSDLLSSGKWETEEYDEPTFLLMVFWLAEYVGVCYVIWNL